MVRAIRIFIGLSMVLTVQQSFAQESWTGMRAFDAIDCAEKIRARYSDEFGSVVEHWERATRTSTFYHVFVEQCTEGKDGVLYFSEQASVQAAVCHFNLREFRDTAKVLLGREGLKPICGSSYFR